MNSENTEHDRTDETPSKARIPVHVDDIDRLNAIARHMEGLMLILEAAAIGDPAFAAVYSMLRPIDEQLQNLKIEFNEAWRLAAAESSGHE